MFNASQPCAKLATPTAKSTLNEWLSYLGALHVSAIDMGLTRVLPVAKSLDITKPTSKVFTVAGTNGKGSVTKTIATLCQTTGLKTALYQSPHVFEFNERISINGKYATDAELIDAFIKVETARQKVGMSLSFFELTTLAAFVFFTENDCDVWVLEIGLGGRLDVVNIIDPDVAIITNIGIDHTDWLGDDIDDIGREKAGILRQSIPCVLGSASGVKMPDSVLDVAQKLNCPLIEACKNFSWQLDSTATKDEVIACLEDKNYTENQQNLADTKPHWLFSTQAVTIRLPLPKLAINNVATGIAAVLAGDIKPKLKQLQDAMQELKLIGRFEQTTWQGKPVVMDAAHNPAGAAFFVSQLLSHFTALKHTNIKVSTKLHVVLSMLSDKDIAGVVEVFAQAFPNIAWYLAPLTSQGAKQRAASVEQLDTAITSTYSTLREQKNDLALLDAQRHHSYALHTNQPHHYANSVVTHYSSIATAFDHAVASATDDEVVVVCGSFHTIYELAAAHKSLLR